MPFQGKRKQRLPHSTFPCRFYVDLTYLSPSILFLVLRTDSTVRELESHLECFYKLSPPKSRILLTPLTVVCSPVSASSTMARVLEAQSLEIRASWDGDVSHAVDVVITVEVCSTSRLPF